MKKRKKFLHHPFTETDYLKRQASAEYAKIKEIEDEVLNFKKEGIKTYVISAGVLYGSGEAIFNNHFEKAWKQKPQKLPIIGEGKNNVPTIHVKDLARMVKRIFENPPEQQYIFGIDNTKKPTQKKLIQAISNGVGTGLVESIDIPIEYEAAHPKQTPLNLHLDWRRFVMLNIKAKPSPIFVPQENPEDPEAEAEGENDFNWHCKSGLQANIQRVKKEFCEERGLKPFKIAVNGKPCSGKSFFAAQLAKHYGVPHIHKEQVLEDIDNWNKEKEAEYLHNIAEKKRLADLAEQRLRDQQAAEEAERKRIEEEKEAERQKRLAELGSEEEGEEEQEEAKDKVEDVDPPKVDETEAPAPEDPLSEDGKEKQEDLGDSDPIVAKYNALMKKLKADEADTEEEFEPLEIKKKIREWREQNPGEKKISSELMSEAFRWRLSQNDCQNRGYILDGYPVCYTTANEVFYQKPPPEEKKQPKLDENGEEIQEEEEEEDPEEAKKRRMPKFQDLIYPDSVILLRGDDDYLMERAGQLGEANVKWDRENLERRLEVYRQNNDLDLFTEANKRTDLGHPKSEKPKYPLIRFF